jgi:hypothetical protein
MGLIEDDVGGLIESSECPHNVAAIVCDDGYDLVDERFEPRAGGRHPVVQVEWGDWGSRRRRQGDRRS